MDSSPLSKLPPELRNCIFEQVLRCNGALEISRRSWRNGVYAAFGCQFPAWLQTPLPDEHLALTKTCRELREVCTPMFYNLNEFLFRSPPGRMVPKFRPAPPPVEGIQYALSDLDKFCHTIGPRIVAALRRCYVVGVQVETQKEEVRSTWYTKLRPTIEVLLNALKGPSKPCEYPRLLLKMSLCSLLYDRPRSRRFEVAIEIDATALQASLDKAISELEALRDEHGSSPEAEKVQHINAMIERVHDCLEAFCESGNQCARAESVDQSV